VTGIIFGGFAGVARSSTPTLFALASGIQWFTLASTFSGRLEILLVLFTLTNIIIPASRGFVLQSWGGDKVSPKEKVSVSAIAGAFAGSAGGLLSWFHPIVYVSDLLTKLHRRSKEYFTWCDYVCALWGGWSSYIQQISCSEFYATGSHRQKRKVLLDELEVESDECLIRC